MGAFLKSFFKDSRSTSIAALFCVVMSIIDILSKNVHSALCYSIVACFWLIITFIYSDGCVD